MFQEPDDTRPLMPFGAPIVPPDADPASGDLMRVEFNRAWHPLILGSVLRLLDDQIWDVATDEDRELADIRANDLLVQLTVDVTEPPFYESDDSADDVVLPESPWYETLSDWVISAFLAWTFTPGAAIVYSTTIPRLRLAFRTGNVGSIVRVLLDNLEIWTGNTNAAETGLLEANLDIDAFALENNLGAPPHILRIEHAGAPMGIMNETSTYKLEVELGDIRPRAATMLLRQNGCVIEVSVDGDNWTTLYDPTSCVDGLIDQGIQDAIDDGILAQNGNQPDPQPAPATGICKTFHAVLPANNQWMLPFAVKTGDTILVTNAKGVWYDGALMGLGLWNCADGRIFSVDSCTTPDPFDPEDPLQDKSHMQIIGRVQSTYFNPFQLYTIPEGFDEDYITFQANDSDISDNMGQVEFDVEVCTGGWCHHFFGADLGAAFEPNEMGYAPASFDGTKWTSALNGSACTLGIQPVLHGTLLMLTRVRWAGTQYGTRLDDPAHSMGIRSGENGWISQSYNAAGPYDKYQDLDGSGIYLTAIWNVTGNASQSNEITDVWLYGNGANPFETNNCES